jgi:hypothetical protein
VSPTRSSEIYGELLDEDRKVSVPSQNSGRIVQIRSEPLLSSPPKIRDHEKNLVVIGGEILCAFGEMEITLGEEQIKFGQIGETVHWGAAVKSNDPNK